MTPAERRFCRDLVVVAPRGTSLISKEEFLRQFSSAVESGRLSTELLERAYRAQNAEDLQCALIVGFIFGFALEQLDILGRLVDAEWHVSHEDVVSALDKLRTVDATKALFRATQWIPEYLSFDGSRALAVKAIWALGRLPGAEAETKLEELVKSDHAILRSSAVEQLDRRSKIS